MPLLMGNRFRSRNGRQPVQWQHHLEREGQTKQPVLFHAVREQPPERRTEVPLPPPKHPQQQHRQQEPR